MATQPDFSRIKSLLQMTGLQQKDNRLYQVIRDIIAATEQQQAYTDQQAAAAASSSSLATTNVNQNILGFLEDNSVEDRVLATPTGTPPGVQGFFTNEVPTGAINGSNKTFTTARSYVAGTLDVYLNGVRQEITLDYTETNSTTFDFVDAPLAGDTVLVDYGTTVAALKGDPGAAGIQGATGPAGTSAANIPPQDGADGEQSFIPGPKGDVGPQGLTGPPIGLFLQDGADGDIVLVPGPRGADGSVDSTAALTYRSTAQTISNAVETAISFDSTLFDASSFFSIGSPTRLTVPAGKNGKYVIVGQISMLITGSGAFDIHIYKNGSKIADNTYHQVNSDISLQAVVIADLVAGDYIELKIISNIGSSQATQGGSNETFLALALCTGNSSATTLTAGTGINISSGVISTVPNVGLPLLVEAIASASATLDITARNKNGYTGVPFQSDYDTYLIVLVNLTPSANGGIYARLSADGGAHWETTNYVANNTYGWTSWGSGGGQTAYFAIALAINATANLGGVNGIMHLFNPLSASIHKNAMGDFLYHDTNVNTPTRSFLHARLANTAAMNSIQFGPTTGGQTLTGTVRIYGIGKN